MIVSEESNPGVKAEVMVLGKRGRKIYQRFGHTVTAEFEKLDLTTKIEEILPLSQMIIKDYIEGKYDKIYLAYTDFVSALRQVPQLKQVLPLTEDATSNLPTNINEYEEDIDKDSLAEGLLFEPSPKEALQILLPRLVEMQIYQAILESDASEHSARMLAMRNASLG